MKNRTPIDRNDLRIKRKDFVLEIGSGQSPMYRSNILIDKFVYSNYHRSGNLKQYPHQKFIQADGVSLPFKDKLFDYVICNQVLEHVDDPISFLKEIERVGKAGYIEIPSFIGESLFPKESHKWVTLEIDKKLVLFEKSKLPTIFPNFGVTFLNYLPYNSAVLRLFYFSNHQIHTVRYEWKDNIAIVVNPIDEFYSSFFTKTWNNEMIQYIFPPKTKTDDFIMTMKVFIHLILSNLKRKLQHYKLMDVQIYDSLDPFKNL